MKKIYYEDMKREKIEEDNNKKFPGQSLYLGSWPTSFFTCPIGIWFTQFLLDILEIIQMKIRGKS